MPGSLTRSAIRALRDGEGLLRTIARTPPERLADADLVGPWDRARCLAEPIVEALDQLDAILRRERSDPALGPLRAGVRAEGSLDYLLVFHGFSVTLAHPAAQRLVDRALDLATPYRVRQHEIDLLLIERGPRPGSR